MGPSPKSSRGPRLLIVSNRLPVKVQRRTVADGSDEVEITRTVGGLATGLAKAHAETDGLWIGWSGLDRPLDAREQRGFDDLGFVPITITEDDLAGYYQGISNMCLWPALHGFVERMQFEEPAWRSYVAVNRAFADAILAHAREDDLVFVQDFHLALVPSMLREEAPWLRIGFFLHVPFPALSTFRMLPRGEAVLEGLLGADVVGFHTSEYVGNFLDCVSHFLGLRVRGTTLHRGGRTVDVVAEPLGLDTEVWGSPDDALEAEIDEEIRALRDDLGDRRLILGVERLDYTKGIPHRIRAFRDLLAAEPRYREDVVFYQIAVPSRQDVEDYATLHEDVTLLVGRTNARFGRVGRQPIHYQYRGVRRARLIALYRLADVCVVTPLRDGLNLVAKEYVASRTNDDGALVLSEFAGVAAELQESLIVNPFDPTELASAMRTGLEMTPGEQQRRMRPMRERVHVRTIDAWTRHMLEKIESAQPGRTAEELDEGRAPAVLDGLAVTRPTTIVLDYDGTLREFTDRPEDAQPTSEIHALLGDLQASDGVQVWIVSGRDREFLSASFPDPSIGYIAEHGAFIRWPEPGRPGAPANPPPPRPMEFLGSPGAAWRTEARAIMESTVAIAPGSHIEEKARGIAWHFRACEDDLGERVARMVQRELAASLGHYHVEVMPGNKVVEVRPRGVSKGRAIRRLMELHQAEADALLVAGDDVTDETMFEELDDASVTILVGDRPTAARYRVADPQAFRALMRSLADRFSARAEGSR